MLYIGLYQTLTVARISEHGLYLTDGEGAEVLLPNRYVSLEDKVGDQIEVFVYHDTLNRLTATREHPYATVGEVAYLEVVDKNVLHAHTFRVPGDELVVVLVDAEEQLQHGDKRYEREDVEHCREQVEHQRAHHVYFVRSNVTSHQPKKFFHIAVS